MFFINYIVAAAFSQISEEQISKIKESLEKRKYIVVNTQIKQETVHFKINTLEQETFTAECKPIEAMESGCIYKQCKNFRSKHEFFAIIKSLNHYNHLKINDVYECIGFLCMIRENFEGGVSLKDSKLFKQNKNDKEKLLINLLKPIFYILDYFLYLRHKSLYHGDITLNNILINEKGKVKICGLFSIKKSYYCEFPKKDDFFSTSAYEEPQVVEYGEDIDLKKLYELITTLLNYKSITSFKNEQLKEFIEDFKDSINIKLHGLFRIRNHKVFDDMFICNIRDFRELKNFIRKERSFIIKKINVNKLICTENVESSFLSICIEIKSIYNNEPSLNNKIHKEFLDISYHINQESVQIPDMFLKTVLAYISSKLLVLKDSASYITFTYEDEFDFLYNCENDTVSYNNTNCSIMMINNIFYIKSNNKIKILNSISSEENHHYKLFLFLSSLFRSFKYNHNKSKLECAKMFEKFIIYQGEIFDDDIPSEYKQLEYKLKLPYVFIYGIGSVERDDENYIYKLENEFEYEIVETYGLFYKIDAKTLKREIIDLTESQKLKIEELKRKIQIDYKFIVGGFIDRFR